MGGIQEAEIRCLQIPDLDIHVSAAFCDVRNIEDLVIPGPGPFAVPHQDIFPRTLEIQHDRRRAAVPVLLGIAIKIEIRYVHHHGRVGRVGDVQDGRPVLLVLVCYRVEMNIDEAGDVRGSGSL